MDIGWLWDHLAREWSTIRQAPATIALLFFIALGICWKRFRGRIDDLKEMVEIYEKKLGLTKSETADPKSLNEALERRVALLEPRSLTPDQENKIAETLYPYRERAAALVQIWAITTAHDFNIYPTYFKRAFDKAEWRSSINEMSQDRHDVGIWVCGQDNNQPSTADLLTEALKRAGIEFSPDPSTEYSFALIIGRKA